MSDTPEKPKGVTFTHEQIMEAMKMAEKNRREAAKHKPKRHFHPKLFRIVHK